MSYLSNGKILILLFFLTIISYTTVAFCDSIQTTSPSNKNVLIINSYHPGLLWSDKEEEGVLSILNKQDNINVFHIYMNSKQFPLSEVENNVYQLIKNTCSDFQLDAVLTLDDNAFDFVMKYRKKLFDDTPIVFAGLNWFTPSRIDRAKGVTGIVESHPTKQNLELIKHLHPNLKTIILLGDSTESGQTNVKNAINTIQLLKAYSNVKIITMVGWSLDYIKNYLSQVDKESVIYLLDFNRDVDGVLIESKETESILKKYTSVPIYTHTPQYIDCCVGGYTLDPVSHGIKAALIVVDILNGKPIDSIPVLYESEIIPMFNYIDMLKHNISIDNIPADSVIINPHYGDTQRKTEYNLPLIVIILILQIILLYMYMKIREVFKKKI